MERGQIGTYFHGPAVLTVGRLPTANPPVAAIRRCQGLWICLQPCRAVPFGAFRTSGNCCGPLSVPESTVSRVQSKAARPTVIIPGSGRDAGQGSQPGDGRRPWLETLLETLLENSLENLLEKSAVQRSQTHAINQLDTVSAGSTTCTTAATSFWRILNDGSVHHVLYSLHGYRPTTATPYTLTATTTASPDDRPPSTPHPTPDPKSSRPTRYTQTSRGPRQLCTRPRPRRSR